MQDETASPPILAEAGVGLGLRGVLDVGVVEQVLSADNHYRIIIK